MKTQQNTDLIFSKIEINDELPAHITPEIVKAIQQYRKKVEASKGSTSFEKEIKEIIALYPEIPIFQNYLAMFHHINGNIAERDRLMLETLKQFPNYVYGWASLIKHYVWEEKLDELDKILGEKPNHIGLQFPTAKSFTSYELQNYTESVVYYYVAKDEITVANSHGKMLNQFLSPNEVKKIEREAKRIQELYQLARIRNSPLLNREPLPKMEVKPQILPKTDEKPVLNHSEFYELYEFGFDDEPPTIEYFEKLLSLPRETAVEDLIKMWLDTITRFDKHNEEETYYNLPLYILVLLAHFEAEEKLADILPFFRQDNEFYEFWIGDWNDHFIYFMAVLSRNHLDTVRDFLCEPNRYEYFRNIFNYVLTCQYQHFPELQTRIAEIYSEILTCFLESEDKENLLDHSFNGFLIGNIAELGLKQHSALIEKLFALNWVDVTIGGDWEKIREEMYEEDRTHTKYLTFPTWQEKFAFLQGEVEATEQVLSKKDKEKHEKWLKNFQKGIFSDIEEISFAEEVPQKITPISAKNPLDKIGRNDKVSVKYTNGKIEKDVKFKKVESDLREGKCELIR